MIKESKSPDVETPTTGVVDALSKQTKTVKAQQLWTTVLTAIDLSSPAASPSMSWRAAEARFYSWRTLESRHKYFFIHTRANSCNKNLLFKVERNCNGLRRDVNLLETEFGIDLLRFKGITHDLLIKRSRCEALLLAMTSDFICFPLLYPRFAPRFVVRSKSAV